MNHVTDGQWWYVGIPVIFYLGVVFLLAMMGDSGDDYNPFTVLFRGISSSLERATGYPGWSMAGVLTALWALGVAVVGLYWDVAFHIDYGRDRQLLTPSHTMILIGLGGLAFAAVITVAFATMEDAQVGFRFLGARIPWSALALGAMGAGGVAAFPLDAIWHDAYGIDVTLWSPTHLQLIAGGALSPIVLWLMMREARRGVTPRALGRLIEVVVLGAVLTGLATFQGEFDFGLPQFQVLYWPLLVVVAAALGLVLARLALGRGGALKATVAFLVLRGGIALVVGPSLHHTVPRFPLYVVAALVVEAAAWWVGDERPLRLALVSGVLVGTVGLAAEVVYAAASGWLPPSPPIALPAAVLGVAGGVSAAVLGAGLAGAALGSKGVSPAALGLAGAALLACLAIPLPRNVGPVEATIRLQAAGAGQARIDVELSPPDAARHASAFGVVSWQGGGRVRAALNEVGPGRYVASRPLPIIGSWKTMVGLQRADQVMAAPIYLPADPRIGASAVPALPERRVAFARNTDVLLREAHGGPAWPAVVAYSGLALILALWIGLWAFTARRAAAEAEGAEPPAPPAHAPAGPWPAGRGAVVRPSG